MKIFAHPAGRSTRDMRHATAYSYDDSNGSEAAWRSPRQQTTGVAAVCWPSGPARSLLVTPAESGRGDAEASTRRARCAQQRAIRERKTWRGKILNSQVQKSLPDSHSFILGQAASEQLWRDPRWARGARNNRRQRPWGDATRPGCLADSSMESHSCEMTSFPPSCRSGRPHGEPRQGPWRLIPQCQSSHQPAMFWQIRFTG